MLDDRIVVPPKLRAKILKDLHSAHQGVSSMYRRASEVVYWPGMEAAIRNQRYTCSHCNERAPSQPREPYCPSPCPLYPFQQICLDYFEVGHHTYLSCVDRFSGWITINHYSQKATSAKLISTLRDIFGSYGVSEEISSDGGPQFTSTEFTTFLNNWGIKHRLSSVQYPQSNSRAELGVKSAKRIILNNTNPDGSLNSDNAVRAILQHRNTPIPELGLSPAQLLLHRQLKDSIPSNPKRLQLHREWVISAEEREKAYAKRNQALETNYNEHSHSLEPLKVQTPVRIQENGGWMKTGRVVEVLPNRQYQIRMDGSGRLSLRNRRFLKPIHAEVVGKPEKLPLSNFPIPSALSDNTKELDVDDDPTPAAPLPRGVDTTTSTTETSENSENILQTNPEIRHPNILKSIKDFNKPGHSEGDVPRARLRGGKDY